MPILVENRLIVELTARKTCADEHMTQRFGYLKAARMEHGLLINFGALKLQIKKPILSAKLREVIRCAVVPFCG